MGHSSAASIDCIYSKSIWGLLLVPLLWCFFGAFEAAFDFGSSKHSCSLEAFECGSNPCNLSRWRLRPDQFCRGTSNLGDCSKLQDYRPVLMNLVGTQFASTVLSTLITGFRLPKGDFASEKPTPVRTHWSSISVDRVGW